MLQSATGTQAATPLRVSGNPFLRRASIRLFSRTQATATLLDSDETVLTTSGRAALALALRELAIGPGDEVLIPAYHCLALSAPVVAMQAKPVSYRMTADLSSDLGDLMRRITPRTRCVIVVHFFGFPAPLQEIREHCDRSGIALIEDCAHAFYGAQRSAPIGRTGDFAIGSLMKFFPLYDGGCLTSFRRRLPASNLRARGPVFQFKALLHVFERSATYSGSRALRTMISVMSRASALMKKVFPGLRQQLAEASPGAVFGSVAFEETWTDARMSLVSRLIVRVTNHARVITRRRSHYQRYVAGLANLPGGSPLRPDLPAEIAPYVFPFVLTDPKLTFPALRAAGVPMYRWEDVDEETCAVARRYKPSLVQFPCHQELTDNDVDLLIATIRGVISGQTGTSATAGNQR